jgi:hypothetical protein
MTPLELLSPEKILELSETEAGSKLLKKTLLQARCAYTLQGLLEILGIVPTEDQQYALCEQLWHNMFEVKSDEILEYVKSFRKHVNENSVDGVYMGDKTPGNC